MKRVFAFLMVLLMVFSMVACSSARTGKDDRDDSTEETEETGRKKGNKTDKSGENEGKDDKNEETGKSGLLTIDIKSPNTGLINEDKIPKEYPLDQVPIPGGSKIHAGETKTDRDKQYIAITCLSEGKYKDIKEFYKELYNDAEYMNLTSETYSCTFEGLTGNVYAIITIRDETHYHTFGDDIKTSIYINLSILDEETVKYYHENFGETGLIDEGEGYEEWYDEGYAEFYPETGETGQGVSPDLDSGDANAVKREKLNTGLIDKDKIPKAYRIDLIPIPEGSLIIDGLSYEENGNRLYAVSGSSKHKLADLVAFYKEIMRDAKDLVIGPMMSGYLIEGTLDGVIIGIFLFENLDEVYKSSFEIQMDMS